LIKEAEKGAYLRIATAVASDWVFLLFGYDYAERMNRKCLGDRLAIPRRKLDKYGRTKPAKDAPDPGAQTTRHDRDPTPAGIQHRKTHEQQGVTRTSVSNSAAAAPGYSPTRYNFEMRNIPNGPGNREIENNTGEQEFEAGGPLSDETDASQDGA
jgi:hypothetical protein